MSAVEQLWLYICMRLPDSLSSVKQKDICVLCINFSRTRYKSDFSASFFLMKGMMIFLSYRYVDMSYWANCTAVLGAHKSLSVCLNYKHDETYFVLHLGVLKWSQSSSLAHWCSVFHQCSILVIEAHLAQTLHCVPCLCIAMETLYMWICYCVGLWGHIMTLLIIFASNCSVHTDLAYGLPLVLFDVLMWLQMFCAVHHTDLEETLF